MAVLLGQAGQVFVPAYRQGQAGGYVFRLNFHRVTLAPGQVRQIFQGRRAFNQGRQFQGLPVPFGQPAHQDGEKVGLGAGPNHKVVIVKGLRVAQEGQVVALPGQGGNGGDTPGPGQIEPGHFPVVAEGFPPDFLPLGHQKQGVDRALGQQLQPFRPDLLEGIEGDCR